jgi:hypothetical protein
VTERPLRHKIHFQSEQCQALFALMFWSDMAKNFPLRIDPALYEVIRPGAQNEIHSVNTHIEFLLRFKKRKKG